MYNITVNRRSYTRYTSTVRQRTLRQYTRKYIYKVVSYLTKQIDKTL